MIARGCCKGCFWALRQIRLALTKKPTEVHHGKPIVKDEAFLTQKSQPATFMDIAVAQDLLDTLAAHADRCVGLAANMIGVQKCVIAVNIGPTNIAMLNPEIIKRSGKYMTEEGCLSLEGERAAVRYEKLR